MQHSRSNEMILKSNAFELDIQEFFSKNRILTKNRIFAINEPAELFCVFHIFTWKSLLYLKFSLPFIVRWIFKIVFFRLKAHFIRKNWLLVHRTTLWASFSHTRVSMVLFYSISARPGPSVIRDSFGVMKILSFLSSNMVLTFILFRMLERELNFLPFLGTDTHPFFWGNKSKIEFLILC